MSKNYTQVSKQVRTGERVFACEFPVRDDYGVNDARWEVYRLGDEWWLQGSYNANNSFAKFAGVPDLSRAKSKTPDPDRVLHLGSELVPNPADEQCDSESAEELFGCGLDVATYEHNAF